MLRCVALRCICVATNSLCFQFHRGMHPSEKAIYDTFLAEANGCKPGRPTDTARRAAFERFWRGERPSFDACADRYKYLKSHKNKGIANAFASALGYQPSALCPPRVSHGMYVFVQFACCSIKPVLRTSLPYICVHLQAPRAVTDVALKPAHRRIIPVTTTKPSLPARSGSNWSSLNLSPENRIATDRQVNALPDGLPCDILNIVRAKASRPARAQPARKSRTTHIPTSVCRPNMPPNPRFTDNNGSDGGNGLTA